jgi:CRP-like cAMP-binding protein
MNTSFHNRGQSKSIHGFEIGSFSSPRLSLFKKQQHESFSQEIDLALREASNKDQASTQISTASQNESAVAHILMRTIVPLVNMDPNQTNHKNLRHALINYSCGKFEESRCYLMKYITTNPCDFISRYLMGMCEFQLENYKESQKHFGICCRHEIHKKSNDTDIAFTFYNRSLAYLYTRSNMCIAKSLKCINRAIQLYDQEPLFYHHRALLLRRLCSFEAAQLDYDIIRKLETSISGETQSEQHTAVKSSSPISRSNSSIELKTSIYGEVQSALRCPASERSDAQIKTLVEESRMMTAFSHFDSTQLETLWRFLEYKFCPTNYRLFEEGDDAEDYFLIWSGSVSARIKNRNNSFLHHSENLASVLSLEKEFTVNIMSAGETLGEAIMTETKRRVAAAVTEEPTELLILNQKHFDDTFHVFIKKIQRDKISFLSTFDIFSGWSKESMDNLAFQAQEKKYHTGEKIIIQGAQADSIYFIHTGIVSLHRSLSCGTIPLAKLSGGELFGESTILDSKEMAKFPYTAVCETITVVYRVDKKQMQKSDWDKEIESIKLMTYPTDSELIKSFFAKRRLQREKVEVWKKIKRESKIKI